MKPTPRRLQITAARHEYSPDGYPALVLTIDGVETDVDFEQKPTLARAGLIYLGGDWEHRADPIDFEVPGQPGFVQRLEGFTADRRVFQLWDRFAAQRAEGRFVPGPVPIPYD